MTYVTHSITCTKPEILKRYVNEDGEFDFNLLIPMPEELNLSDEHVESGLILAIAGVDLEKPFFASDYKRLDKVHFWMTDEIIARHISSLRSEPREKREELYKLGLRYRSNAEKYGSPSREGWRLKHWSSPWNAVHTSIDHNGRLTFDTRALSIEPIFRQLAKDLSKEGAIMRVISYENVEYLEIENAAGSYAEYKSDASGELFLLEEGEFFYNIEKDAMDYLHIDG